MKKKLLKIMALCLCTISLGISLCSCSFIDGVFDIVDMIVDSDKTSGKENNDSSTDNVPVHSSYIIDKTVEYDGFSVTYPEFVRCRVGDTFEINITASHMDTLTYELVIIDGRDDYFSVDGHTVTALSLCTWEICAKVSDLDIWYLTNIEVYE